MSNSKLISAGLLLFRRTGDRLELFLAHPGGPFWARRDQGAWTIPKGVADPGEDLLDAAQREFAEETGFQLPGPFLPLGSVRQRSGKVVHAWACEGDVDPALAQSNTMQCEWPPKSGQWITVPEVDRCAWFDPETARGKINSAQVDFIDRLEDLLRKSG
ncbi:MAG TPA: NUDIX domain-containing protein [Chthoniobacteraceae bacterium]|jgi:predicted NUDIX family NTP pyrophosphohydrolase